MISTTFKLAFLCLLVSFVLTSDPLQSSDSSLISSKALPISLNIHQTPEEPVVIEGIPLQLDCQLEYLPNHIANDSESSLVAFGLIPSKLCYQWVLNGQPISDDPRRYQNGPRLHFASVRHSLDLGEYKCLVSDSNSGLRAQSDAFVLNILCKILL